MVIQSKQPRGFYFLCVYSPSTLLHEWLTSVQHNIPFWILRINQLHFYCLSFPFVSSFFRLQSLPLEGVKRKIIRSLRLLENQNKVTTKNNYQDIVNAIAKVSKFRSCCATPHHTTSHHTTPHHTTPLHCTTPHHTTSHYATSHHTTCITPCHTTPHRSSNSYSFILIPLIRTFVIKEDIVCVVNKN